MKTLIHVTKSTKQSIKLSKLLLMKIFLMLFIFTANLFVVSASLAYEEVPYLEDLVKQNILPPIDQRLPEKPLLTLYNKEFKKPGEYGGNLKMLMGKDKDIRMMNVYGYARLVGFDDNLVLNADILESFEVDEFKIFTFKLRKGHRWSDGHPFTVDDFKFYWDHEATDDEISPFGPPKVLLVNGQPPLVEILDEYTIRYSWDSPNHMFLSALAAPQPLYLFMPAHYMKQYHRNFVDVEVLERQAKEAGASSWAGLFQRLSNAYKFDNPDLPVLQPWINTTKMPSNYFEYVRNPYYHRVDENGKQLPYIDKVSLSIVSADLISAKTGAGESDLQGRYLKLEDYTFLKERENKNNYNVYLWKQAKGSQVAFYPNFTTKDNSWRNVIRDLRFRAALSMGINRRELNQVLFFGLAKETGNTVLENSQFDELKDTVPWLDYNLEYANRLLDEMGFTERDKQGIRIMPILDDTGQAIGKQRMELIVHSAGESSEESDALELITDSWAKLGIKLLFKPSQREVFRQRINSGEVVMSVWQGLDNAMPTMYNSPREFVPSAQDQLQWSSWGNYYETNGQAGEAVDMPDVKTMMENFNQWKTAETSSLSIQSWQSIIKNYNQNLYSIGTVTNVPIPLVVNKNLMNVPDNGIYAWEPFSYFGVYRMDSFWFQGERANETLK